MLPFTAVVPMDVAQQAYVQVRAEERVRFGSDINAAETEINPQLRYDFIWRGGQNHFVAIYQPRPLQATLLADLVVAAFTIVTLATLSSGLMFATFFTAGGTLSFGTASTLPYCVDLPGAREAICQCDFAW